MKYEQLEIYAQLGKLVAENPNMTQCEMMKMIGMSRSGVRNICNLWVLRLKTLSYKKANTEKQNCL